MRLSIDQRLIHGGLQWTEASVEKTVMGRAIRLSCATVQRDGDGGGPVSPGAVVGRSAVLSAAQMY